MIYETLELKDEEQQIFKIILKRVQTLIDSRNNIIHSTWFVGWANPQDIDFSEASGHKLIKGKSGAGVKNFKYTSSDFDKLSNECDAVVELINRLWACTTGNYEISKNFIITETGSVSVPSNN